MLHWISISLRKKSRLVAMPMWQEQFWGSSVMSVFLIFPTSSDSSFLLLDCSWNISRFVAVVCLFVCFFNLQEFVCAPPSAILHLPGSFLDSSLFCICSAINGTLWFRTHDRLSSYFTVLCPYCLFPSLSTLHLGRDQNIHGFVHCIPNNYATWGTSGYFKKCWMLNVHQQRSVLKRWGTCIQWNITQSFQFSSVTQSCPTLCDLMDCSKPGFPVHHQNPELAQTHVHRVSDTIQLSHPLSSPSSAFNLSQHQGLFKWICSSHQVAKVLEFQLQR